MATELKQMELSDGPYVLTACGFEIAGDSTHQQWEQCGQALRQVDEAR